MSAVLHDLVCMGCAGIYRAMGPWIACARCGSVPGRIIREYDGRCIGRPENEHYNITTTTTGSTA